LSEIAATNTNNPEPNSPALYAIPVAEVLRRLATDADNGLSGDRIDALRREFGYNELREAPPVPSWKKFLQQFNELVIWILIVAAIISGVSHDWPDAIAILAIVLLNGTLGFFQEERAAKALESLRKLSAPNARVIRDGKLQSIPARELLPGDRIELEAGDNVPADALLIESFSLRVQEASLTGESVPAEKSAGEIVPEGTPLGDRHNMVYMSTIVATGKAKAVVTATGMGTELGHIAGLLQRDEPEPTPLQRRLAELGKVLVVVCLAIVAIIFVLEMLRGGKLSIVFIRAISLAVAAVPEGLPAVVTMALALGLQRMVARNVLIRRLPSVETLGSVTVICSDKTGTLTRNEMTVRAIVTGGGAFRVTGSGYVAQGEFHRGLDEGGSAAAPESAPPDSIPDLRRLLMIGARCNGAQVAPAKEGGDGLTIIGDPTEGALLIAALKAGIDARTKDHHTIHEIPFDSDRKAMSVVVQETDGPPIMYTKGAPEVILGMCETEQRDGEIVALTAQRRDEISAANSRLAARALRVLALAYRELPGETPGNYSESQLTFAGLVGMIDPPREEVKAAVARCHGAGIRPVMITGDHPETAAAIARELKIADGSHRTVTGQQLGEMSDEQLAAEVGDIAVYARVAPEHKLRVVNAWKKRGEVVAMTGDGVNDAPAVRASDIGIAMGITGTDVTKDASDMVLTDDNFTSIVNAVEEGRGIFDNIQKFIHFLLSCNAGEVLLMFFAALLGWPAPLHAVQLLWINLVTDGLPALALAMEPPEEDIMDRPPRPPREPVITRRRGLLILLNGVLIAAAGGAGFALVYRGEPANEEVARTVAFCIMSFSQLLLSLGFRSQSHTMFELGPFTNPYLLGAICISSALQLSAVLLPFARPFFEVQQLPDTGLWLIVVLSLAPVTLVEMAKIAMVVFSRSRRH
jgi:P-type Ca2+ transporter type 2C